MVLCDDVHIEHCFHSNSLCSMMGSVWFVKFCEFYMYKGVHKSGNFFYCKEHNFET